MSKVELTPANLAELRQKAEAAEKESPSPWYGGRDGIHWVLVDSENADIHTTCNERNIADFIAHANPATVLAMVEEIEQLRRMERKWGQMLKNVKDTAPDLETFLSPDAFKINESEAGQ